MNPARRPVLFLVPSIRSGGMERLVSIMLRGLDRARFRPELLVLHRVNENAAFRSSIPDDVRVISLEKRSRMDAVRILRLLVGRYREDPPAVAIGFMTYANLLLIVARVLARTRVPVIATEHVTPDSMKATIPKRVQLILARRLYRRAAAVVAVSTGVRDAFVRQLRLRPESVHAIHNPYDPNIDAELANAGAPHAWLADGGPTLVAAGRLAPQKAYPVLLRALARIRAEVPARLLILGEGAERDRLQRLARDLGLAGAVEFAGFVDKPFRYMRDASSFVLSSDWESFGFVLVEAARAGAAIVSTDCEYGPNEIIEHERSGLLVKPGDPEALALAVLCVLREPGLADRLRTAARARSELFAPEQTLRRYEALIDSVIAAGGGHAATDRST